MEPPFTPCYEANTSLSRAVMEAGWMFSKPEVIEDMWESGEITRGLFACPCGKTEKYMIKHDASLDGVIERLYHLGSFSYKHLIADGYPEEVAKEMSDKISQHCKI